MKKSIISVERCVTGGYILSTMLDDRRVARRYIGYTLREARQKFLIDFKKMSRN